MTEFFPGISAIKFEGVDSKNPLSYKHYNKDEVIMGKKMSEWLRFSVVWWHTFRGTGGDPFGAGTMSRPWEDGTDSVEMALKRVDMAFEFFVKLGVDYYCFHDRDIAPEGKTLEETNKNLDIVTDYMLQKQKETGVKLLWGTANLFGHPRYMNGAGTSPDANIFAYAAAQVKKAMELTLKLGGVNYVMWGGREGYQSVLNTDVKRELDHFAAFCKMAIEHKKKIGADFQFLIEPKPREPMKHQYDYDAQTVIGFLKTYGLDNDFKLNIEPNHTTLAGHDFEHDIMMASKYNMLGSVDCNTGDPLLGWDTDQFLMDTKKATLLALFVTQQGGLAPGGLNFDAKLRRESTDLEDMFIAHIGSMDCFALGLRTAAKITEDKELDTMLQKRYETFNTGLGKEVEDGTSSFEKCEAHIHALEKASGTSCPLPPSGKQELFEMVLNRYCF